MFFVPIFLFDELIFYWETSKEENYLKKQMFLDSILLKLVNWESSFEKVIESFQAENIYEGYPRTNVLTESSGSNIGATRNYSVKN